MPKGKASDRPNVARAKAKAIHFWALSFALSPPAVSNSAIAPAAGMNIITVSSIVTNSAFCGQRSADSDQHSAISTLRSSLFALRSSLSALHSSHFTLHSSLLTFNSPALGPENEIADNDHCAQHDHCHVLARQPGLHEPGHTTNPGGQ